MLLQFLFAYDHVHRYCFIIIKTHDIHKTYVPHIPTPDKVSSKLSRQVPLTTERPVAEGSRNNMLHRGVII